MRIIVVDDREEERYLAETLLKGSGYEVVTAVNGAEALEKLRTEGFDMIVSDVLMPVMDGFRLCRECKGDEKLKDIPFVFYTATYKDEKDEELASKVGADKYIRKPIEPEEFVKIIQGLFRDVEEGKIGPKKPALEEEKEVFKLYSERLIAKLEKKMLELEAESAQRKQAQERLEHLNLVLRAIRGVNQLIIREKDRDRLLKGACDNLIQNRGYYGAWIALLDESGGLLAAAEAGLGKNFLPMVERLKRGELPQCGPRALRQSDVVISEDVSSACGDCPFAKQLQGRGALTIRLEYDEKVYGLLVTSIPGEFATGEEEQSLLHEVAGDIAFALHDMELEEERKRAEKTLRQNERELELLLESLPELLFYKDINDRLLRCNRNFAEVLHMSPEEVVGKTTDDLYPEQAQDMKRDDREVLETGQAKLGIIEAFDTPGGRRWVQTSKVPIRDETGRLVVGLLGIATDITETVRMEKALRESEERYRTVLEEMEDSYFEVDLGGHITFANDSTCCNLRFSREELIGKSYKAFSAEKDFDTVYKAFNQAYRTGKPAKDLSWEVVRGDGTTGFAEATVLPLRNEAGQITGFRGIGRDITERKRMEEERRELEQKAQLASRLASVGEMASGIAHEINNPLTGVIGYSQLLMQKDIPENMKEGLEVIRDGGQRVAGIVKRLLTFARQVKTQRDYVSINEIIETTLALKTYELETNNIKTNLQLDPDLPVTIADGGQLQQVFLNLIINAETEMKLAHGKGKLSIETGKVDDTIRISFKDDGPGIAKENLDRVFDPFFTTRKVGEGTGLGLSVCHGIMAEHGGTMYVESELRKGATFIVELPIVLSPEQLKLAEPAAEEPHRVARAKILVVDDEPAVLKLLSQLLADEGHHVETVDNADNAVEMVNRRSYSLILLDIKMPGMSGIELYKHFQKEDKSLARRIVFITGDVMGAGTQAFISRTKAPYITKPFDADQLKKEINRILRETKS